MNTTAVQEAVLSLLQREFPDAESADRLRLAEAIIIAVRGTRSPLSEQAQARKNQYQAAYMRNRRAAAKLEEEKDEALRRRRARDLGR